MVLGGAGGFEFQTQSGFQLIKVQKGSLVGFGREWFFQIHGPAHRHQKENMVGHGAQVSGSDCQGFRLVQIGGGESAVNLEGEAGLPHVGRSLSECFK
jgi:hypothetical protein